MTLSGGPATARYKPVDRQQDDGTYGGDYYRNDHAAAADADKASQESAHEGSSYPDQDRDDYSARVVARHDELGQRAGDQTDNDPAYNCAYTHFLFSPS